MRLCIRHETRYSYEGTALGATMRLRLKPMDSPVQRIEDWRISVNGEPVENFTANSYGVPEALWRTGQRISEAVVVAEGIVETADRAGIIGFPDEAASPRIFLRQGDFTKADGALVEMAAEARTTDGPLASLHNLSHIVHGRMRYRKDSTDSATTAAQALEMGGGVCQDFAHVFIAAAREMGVPTRYVAGYVYDEEGEMDAEEIGQSHGWAEAFVEGLGWVGFDPTRKICVTDQYVRLSWGVDAFDSAPLRGVAALTGGIGMNVDVQVATAPILSQKQAQSQQQ
ncbi:transglutaminase family protein [Sphingobium sufflavum]|uniref:transglutaminase family protein n=1 Tax=Sphingobium sufflavum TaxID=1129547 RepID=UPI001F42B1A2|nr:transglutaminase family protein [Sphingobium sufflavum]MCE7797394.1 transglutaminase family protein [Sphingobium sufflavum]